MVDMILWQFISLSSRNNNMIDSKTANGHIRHAKISADSDKSRDRVFRCLKKYQLSRV